MDAAIGSGIALDAGEDGLFTAAAISSAVRRLILTPRWHRNGELRNDDFALLLSAKTLHEGHLPLVLFSQPRKRGL